MPWTYSGDPSTSALDEVRFYIGDTDDSRPQINDEEINFLINKCSGNTMLAASMAARNIAAHYSGLSDKTVGGLSISYRQRYDQYIQLADSLATQATTFFDGPPILGGGGRTYLGGNWP